MKAREIAAHATHLVILLLPTWTLSPIGAWDGWVGSFAAIVVLAGLLESRSVSAVAPPQATKIQNPSAMVMAQLVGIGLLVLFWSIQVERQTAGMDWPVIQVAGGLTLVLGILLRVTAIRTLGTDFVSDIRVPSLRRTDGIYRWLDHPSEIGLIFVVTGAPLLLGAPRCLLVACLFFLPTSLLRIRRENRALAVGG